MRNRKMKMSLTLYLLALAALAMPAQSRPAVLERGERSPLSTFFIAPTRIVWQSTTGVQDAKSLLEP